ncbi:MAG TPA: hypothetical protein VEC36_11400 [Patescibacteria group bacterium]|nr:hypothetical protein [Patescibacteria group bacterium]
MLLATGPFHMLPGDTTYLTVAFTFAKRDTANENYAELIRKIEAVRDTLFKNNGEEIPEATPTGHLLFITAIQKQRSTSRF